MDPEELGRLGLGDMAEDAEDDVDLFGAGDEAGGSSLEAFED